MPKIPQPTISPRERAFLVGTELANEKGLLSLEDSLRELTLLADTAGLVVVGQVTQRLRKVNPKTLVGTGKLQEIQDLATEADADVVLFDDELSPRHQRELEGEFPEDVQVLDRTALILDIFAQHANTREGALQVELAQYEYRLPRLTRAWTHLARQAGGGGGRAGGVGGVGLRGPGEMQLEVDRREITRRIAHLRSELEKVRGHRQRYRERRKRARMPTVALVGYTNAGKSTLLNSLSDADVLVADQLFATLDPTTRRVELPGARTVLVTDTVGFIQKLPATLVAAFRATLEEIGEADLLLHVVDSTHPNALQQASAVFETLAEIGVDEIPMITALNKIDKLETSFGLEAMIDRFDRALAISALTGEGIPELLLSLERELFESMIPVRLHVPYEDGDKISLFHEQGIVDHVEQMEEGVMIQGRLPRRWLEVFEDFTSPEGPPFQEEAAVGGGEIVGTEE